MTLYQEWIQFYILEKLSLLSWEYADTHYLYYAHVDYVHLLFITQIISWKEQDDKMVAVVHLDQKEIEDHQDWLG